MGKKGRQLAPKLSADSQSRQAPTRSKESNKYIRTIQEQLLQPSNKHYGGMGYAKGSVFLQLDDPDYNLKFGEIWEEHVPGFSGKSFKRRKTAAEDGMLWRQRLKAKQAAEGTAKVLEPTKEAKASTKQSKHRDKVQAHEHKASAKVTVPQTKPENGMEIDQQKKKAAQLQSDIIAAYRQLKKSKKTMQR